MWPDWAEESMSLTSSMTLNLHWFHQHLQAMDKVRSNTSGLTPWEYVEKHEMEESSEALILTQDVV